MFVPHLRDIEERVGHKPAAIDLVNHCFCVEHRSRGDYTLEQSFVVVERRERRERKGGRSFNRNSYQRFSNGSNGAVNGGLKSLARKKYRQYSKSEKKAAEARAESRKKNTAETTAK
jgi:hypothetical protein